ncbi:hypothetical protein ACO0LF_17555 [Undibacterium sp. Di27W]|uniref:hypothetical protein n=1 Tax=Undibacterium sp. Di27W TaxID=3413036 RepID=UPI003BF15E18
MYSIHVGAVSINFASAVMTVVRQIQDHDWHDEEGVYVPQAITIKQNDSFAILSSEVGFMGEKGPHHVKVCEPAVYTVLDLAKQLAGVKHNEHTLDEILQIMMLTDYPWGKLLACNWSKLDYVPGGISYYLLPNEHPAISIGKLQLDWPTVEVMPRDVVAEAKMKKRKKG